ncbi:hypothetical protein Tco_0685068 [Tanacetum coccineum]
MTPHQHIYGALDGLQSPLLLLRGLPLIHRPANVETTFPDWVRSFELSFALSPFVVTRSLKLPEVSLFRRLHFYFSAVLFRCFASAPGLCAIVYTTDHIFNSCFLEGCIHHLDYAPTSSVNSKTMFEFLLFSPLSSYRPIVFGIFLRESFDKFRICDAEHEF